MLGFIAMQVLYSSVDMKSNYEKISFSYEKLDFRIITSNSNDNKKFFLDLNINLVDLTVCNGT